MHNTLKAAIAIALGIAASGFPAVAGAGDANVSVTVLEANEHAIRISFEVNDFVKEPVDVLGQRHFRIVLAGEANRMPRGLPDLPSVTRSLIIPNHARMEVAVVGGEHVDYHLPVAPSRGAISRLVDRDEVTFEFGPEYDQSRFCPHQVVELSEPYIMRDFRGIAVTVNPFVYHPITRTLRLHKKLVVELWNVGIDDRNVKAGGEGPINPYFAEIYQNHFLNFPSSRYDMIDEEGRMVVICHPGFMEAIQPYVDWKRQKGIKTDLYDATTIGATTNDIRAFIQNEYDQYTDLTFVQLVGDYEQIPSILMARDFCDGMATSDATYAMLEGGDAYPDIFVGRFSAQTVDHVTTQVARTVWYERDLVSGEWLRKGCGVGSAWGEGYGYLGLRDRDLIEELRQMLLGYTYTEVDQLYEWGEPPFGIIPVPIEDFINALNEGRGIVLTSAHADCEATFMIPPGEFDHLFTLDSVYALQNAYMLPFMSLGAPYLGDFQIGEAYPEAWLRATNGLGDPIGAIAVYASSVDLDYATPGAAQYEMVQLLVDEVVNSFGGLTYNGACHAADVYGSRGVKTLLSYHIFGDASLQVRTNIPVGMTVTCDSMVLAGASSFDVTVAGVQHALCALSRNAELLGAAYTDTSGYALIEFEQPLPSGEPLDLVVTAYNRQTKIRSVAVPEIMCGDVNGDGQGPNIVDVTYLVNFLFDGGPPPPNMEAADMNGGDGDVNIVDLTQLVGYLFGGGPAPDCG